MACHHTIPPATFILRPNVLRWVEQLQEETGTDYILVGYRKPSVVGCPVTPHSLLFPWMNLPTEHSINHKFANIRYNNALNQTWWSFPRSGESTLSHCCSFYPHRLFSCPPAPRGF